MVRSVTANARSYRDSTASRRLPDNSTEPIDGYATGGHWLGGNLFGIPFMAIGGPPVDQPLADGGIENFRIEKFELVI